MFLFLIVYLALSFLVLTLWAASGTDTALTDIKPSLGRRILLIILFPSVFILGLIELVTEALKKEIEWGSIPVKVKEFFSEAKEVWDGR